MSEPLFAQLAGEWLWPHERKPMAEHYIDGDRASDPDMPRRTGHPGVDYSETDQQPDPVDDYRGDAGDHCSGGPRIAWADTASDITAHRDTIRWDP